LGDDIQQRGSLVDNDKLRFDFSHAHAMTDKQVEQVEQLVNQAIENDKVVDAQEVPLELAQSIYGVRAVFGERYPNPVRVVSIGTTVQELLQDPTNESWYESSVEFCGGTHLEGCGGAGHFIVLHEQALASGVRRILAVTGVEAKAAHEAGVSLLQQIEEANQLEGQQLCDAYDDCNRLVDELSISQTVRRGAKARLKELFGRVKGLQKEAASSRRDVVLEQARTIADSDENIIVASIDGADKDSIMTAIDAIRSKRPDGAAMLFTANHVEGKVIIVASVSKAMIGRGLKAGDWIREAAKVCGGGGGGRPDTAQAGGKDPGKVPVAMETAMAFANEVTQ
jgi:alanyl-tRNA synthetase